MQACESAYSSWKFSGGFRTWVKMSLVKTKEEDGREAVEFRQEVVACFLVTLEAGTLRAGLWGGSQGQGDHWWPSGGLPMLATVQQLAFSTEPSLPCASGKHFLMLPGLVQLRGGQALGGCGHL